MSDRKLTRRDFLTGMIAASAASLALRELRAGEEPVIAAAASGPDPAASTRAAIEALGGIGRFVKRGQRVMLLPNPQGRTQGTSTRPEIVYEVASLCREAGASKVEICSIHSGGRWQGTGIDKAAERAGVIFRSPETESDWATLEIKGGRRHKAIQVVRQAVEYDVLINMPIAKHHGSTRYTGTLKNLMGVNSNDTAWHNGTAYLVDSIVDLASAVRQTLCVVDATVILAENGPFGPGRVIRPQEVIAGTDPVAIDSYCAGLLGMKSMDVATIRQGAERGLGAMNFAESKTGEGLKILRQA